VSARPSANPSRVIRSFGSLEGLGAYINAHTGPAQSDDLPVIAGQPPGPRRRATHDELVTLFANEPSEPER
jgi:hypothetical protein